MRIINGKLIHRGTNEFEEIIQKTETINQRCDYLETQYLQKFNQEVYSNKSYVQKLEQRIDSLENMTSTQGKQLSFLKISGVIGLLSLWLIMSIGNQAKNEKSKPEMHSEIVELIQA